jgi:hypothetical protein
MDILGYTKIIQDAVATGKQQDILRSLYVALTKGRDWLEDKDLSHEFKEQMGKDDYALKAFTDNIVIGWPTYKDGEGELGAAFLKLQYFQLQMVLNGFFIRGALSVNDAYIDEIAVFGTALIEAHEGESNLAHFPRIILMPSAVNTTKMHMEYHGGPKFAKIQEVLRDSDGQWFINYLGCLVSEDFEGEIFHLIMDHKKMVGSKLSEFRNQPAIWPKYVWVARYHNYFCELHKDVCDSNCKIDDKLYAQNPSLIVSE